jgi:hypothetical protein
MITATETMRPVALDRAIEEGMRIGFLDDRRQRRSAIRRGSRKPGK